MLWVNGLMFLAVEYWDEAGGVILFNPLGIGHRLMKTAGDDKCFASTGKEQKEKIWRGVGWVNNWVLFKVLCCLGTFASRKQVSLKMKSCVSSWVSRGEYSCYWIFIKRQHILELSQCHASFGRGSTRGENQIIAREVFFLWINTYTHTHTHTHTHIYMYIYIYLPFHPQSRMQHKILSTWSLTGLNSEFFFLSTSCSINVKEPSLPYNLLLSGETSRLGL